MGKCEDSNHSDGFYWPLSRVTALGLEFDLAFVVLVVVRFSSSLLWGALWIRTLHLFYAAMGRKKIYYSHQSFINISLLAPHWRLLLTKIDTFLSYGEKGQPCQLPSTHIPIFQR